MSDKISIGRVKRDISELVNRVAYGGERIVLTSRGKPKAALVSIEDYEKLRTLEPDKGHLQSWKRQTQMMAEAIMNRREGKEIDVEKVLVASRDDLEGRGD